MLVKSIFSLLEKIYLVRVIFLCMSPHASVQCLLVFMTLSYGFLTLGPAPKCIPHPDRWGWVSDS